VSRVLARLVGFSSRTILIFTKQHFRQASNETARHTDVTLRRLA
jgi:hypothetical protein